MSAGLLLIRLVFVVLMAGHGTQKLFGWLGGYGIAAPGSSSKELASGPGAGSPRSPASLNPSVECYSCSDWCSWLLS